MAPSPPSPSQNLPQLYNQSSSSPSGQSLLSQWTAVQQAAAAHQAAFAAAVSAATANKNNFMSQSSPPHLPVTSSSSVSPPSSSPLLRHPSMPHSLGFQRFSPYVIPNKRVSPSPGNHENRSSPITSSSPSPASPMRS